MPPLEYAEHIIAYLHEVGLCHSSGMGLEPLNYQLISAWSHVTSTDLLPWEAIAMQTLSSEYVSQLREAESLTCHAPFIGGDRDYRRSETDTFFRNLKAKQDDRHSHTKR